ncbi:carboxyl transferase domain-containing protein [Compostimonas suwonensis]|uniref:Acetyl-CoA carboxylase carboxyl transferase subunit beta n=1 Tax=Compostimonas suwonensis TaxID=1048394 RepID=A0A2M9C4D1_9MICO|nr:carboxyl transferase domain-containing protein [Compostimonas suwonensis]PJJ65349.1 acetyl-CoA carboxylase carboxyl transferase subunit beta [Compostimonas suwonensis]
MSEFATARAAIADLVDPGSFDCWDDAIDRRHRSAGYRATLDRAQERAGLDESVTTGRASIGGHDVAVIVSEFGFLGGSIGVDAAERIIRAIRRATGSGLPLIASTASGGTRMQEGTPAFVRMADITRALVAHKRKGLPYLVHLRNPTTGGVFASWASLGQVTIAEPGAFIGFLGPRVVAALGVEPVPDWVQRSENLAEHGVIDIVVDRRGTAAVLACLIDLFARRTHPTSSPEPAVRQVEGSEDVWISVAATRSPDRPGLREFMESAASQSLTLRGTSGRAVMVAIARIAGIACIVVGQDRRAQVRHAIGATDLQTARAGIELAAELGLPLITVVDTAGAEISIEAEQASIAGEIARCVAALVAVETPTVAILLGQGAGGAALALTPARRIVAAERAWLAPLSPEGAAAIVHSTIGRTADIAREQRIAAGALREDGILDAVVSEESLDRGDVDDFFQTIAHQAAALVREQDGAARHEAAR